MNLPSAPPALDITLATSAHAVDAAALRRLVRRVAAGERAVVHDLTVVLAGHALVRDLNRRFLGHDYDTDVVSFPLGDPPRSPHDARALDGEVYVDLDTAAERHEEFGVSFADEVRRYVVHGVLHLAGYDDATPPERRALRALEDHYLRAADPGA